MYTVEAGNDGWWFVILTTTDQVVYATKNINLAFIARESLLRASKYTLN